MSAGKGQDLSTLQHELHELDPRYRLDKIIGAGSYGVVLKGLDTVTQEAVAVKKISKVIFQDTRLAKRILREVKLLAHFHKNVIGEHRAENIIGLRNLITPKNQDFNEFWIVMELAESDMKSVFRSGQKLSLPQVQYMLYQMLHGLKTMKAAQVIHRDITPANILVSYADLDIKICDFGLAREEPKEDDPFMTDYVTMRWYRAPELVMESKEYDEKVDMWGLGCIMAEMFGSRPLFRGADRINQLDKIIEIVGSPELDDLMGSQAAQRYVRERYVGPTCKKGIKPRTNWKAMFPDVMRDEENGENAIDLLDKMLQFNPKKRIKVEEALEHPFMAVLHDSEDEDTSDVPHFDFSDKHLTTIGQVKQALYEETLEFHRRNPSTMTRELKARMQSVRQDAGSLATTGGDVRTGFEGTVNPTDAAEDAEFKEHAVALPPDVDGLIDCLASLAEENADAEKLNQAIGKVMASDAAKLVENSLRKVGWNGKGFGKKLSEGEVQQLILEIRSAFKAA